MQRWGLAIFFHIVYATLGYTMGETMGLKEHEYIRQTLERYTNCKLEDFCSHVMITNFRQYIKAFSERTECEIQEGNF